MGEKKLPLFPHIIGAGVSGVFAEVITLPFDTAKVRLMTMKQSGDINPAYKGLFSTVVAISKQEGPHRLWLGLVPGIHRQLVYCGLRVTLYDSLIRKVVKPEDLKRPPIYWKAIMSLSSGALAISVANPTDVVKVRMQADRSKGKPRYSGTLSAYSTIIKEEGFLTFWKGVDVNIYRNAIINCAELTGFFQCKQWLVEDLKMKDGLLVHAIAGSFAGFLAVVFGNPVDFCKNRIQNAKKGSDKDYKGILDVIGRTLKEEGPLAFYSGASSNFVRLVSWNLLMFVAYGQVKEVLHQYYDWDK